MFDNEADMTPVPKILVVDDEPVIVKLLTVTLEKYGYEVVSASDGGEAISKVALDGPDLILLDINMPGMDGFQALEILKKDEDTAMIPVVMLTGMHKDRDDRLRCLELGADDFLTKPFDEHELVIRIRNHTRLKMLNEVELEKEHLKGALEMAQAASRDMRGLLENILQSAELMTYDRDGDLPREKYFKQFKKDVDEFVILTERLAFLDI